MAVWDVVQALVDFEEVLGMEPPGYVGDDFSRVTQIYRVTQYNISCCYSAMNQVNMSYPTAPHPPAWTTSPCPHTPFSILCCMTLLSMPVIPGCALWVSAAFFVSNCVVLLMLM